MFKFFSPYHHPLIFLLISLASTLKCPLNCDACTSQSICTTCSPFYTLFPNSTCSSCKCYAPNCLYCSCPSSNICSVCDQGYTYNNPNGCTKNLNQNYLIGSIVGGTLGIIILILIYIRYFRNCRQNALERESLKMKSDVKLSENQKMIQLEIQFDRSKDHCPICLQNNCDIITSCNHYFHKQCLNKWIGKHQNCPDCKNNNMEFLLLVNCLICRKKAFKIFRIVDIQNNVSTECREKHDSLILSSKQFIVKSYNE